MIKKQTIIILFLLVVDWMRLNAQTSKAETNYLLRVYEDNDCYNVLSKTTDCSYSNGTQINLFYTRAKPSGFFNIPGRNNKQDSTIRVAGWGLMQILFTPKNIASTSFQPNDYPYAGALFITRSVYSYHPGTKYDLQTELSLGVRGPAALGAEIQRIIHRFVGNKKAMGWDHQLGNKLYANLAIKAEQGLLEYDKLEVIAAAQALMGTMVNSIGVGPLIRFGKMTPYFKGFLTNYKAWPKGGNKNDIQFYLVIKPEVLYIIHYGLLTGELQAQNGSKTNYANSSPKLNYSIDAGAVMVYKNWGFSYTQNSSGAYLPGLYNHNVGNLSFYFSW